MANIDELRKKFYEDDIPPPLPQKAARAISSFVDRALDASDDDADIGRDINMNVGRDLPDLFSSISHESDLQQLIRHWQNERHAPEILQSQDVLLGRILDQIRRQTNDANALRRDANLSEEDHYMTMLVQTEVERVKFVVRSYIRTRLFKIEQFAAHITSDLDIQSRLSEAELRHAQRYAELLVSQFRIAVLDHLPETQQGLDDDVVTMPSMITEPDKERAVFTRAREACGPVLLPDGTAFQMNEGSIQLMRYRTIEQLLALGQVELV